MSGYRISVRLNLERWLHQKVFEILAEIPNRKKADFIIYAILTANEREKTIEEIAQVVQKAMSGTVAPKSNEESSVNMVMDYLDNL